jgi:hypothetical protein
MGPGQNPYKYRWNEGAEPLVRVTVYGRTARGRALRAWETKLKPAARAVRDRLRRARAVEGAQDASPDQGGH